MENYTQILALVLSAVATVLSALLSTFAKRGFSNLILDFGRTAPSKEISPPEDNVSIRLREVREELKRQKRIATINRYASSILTFGQFIIGGLLATSFLQENLSKPIVGLLGLLVLSSSLVRQYYRPDIQAAAATGRAAKLKFLIRKAQDQFYLSEQGVANAIPRHEVLALLSDGLSQIEESEAKDLQPTVNQTTTESKALEQRSAGNPRDT